MLVLCVCLVVFCSFVSSLMCGRIGLSSVVYVVLFMFCLMRMVCWVVLLLRICLRLSRLGLLSLLV